MPSYTNEQKKYAQRLLDCNEGLDSVFSDINITPEFEKQLDEIKSFYISSFKNTLDDDAGISVARQYQTFIVTLSEVRGGSLTADEALEIIQETKDDRQDNIIVQNILKVCELLFWVAAAALCYAASITIGIPLLFLEPLTGIFVAATSAILFYLAADLAAECFGEFESFDSVDEEHTRETNAISFFSPPSPRRTSQQLDDSTERNGLKNVVDVYPAVTCQ